MSELLAKIIVALLEFQWWPHLVWWFVLALIFGLHPDKFEDRKLIRFLIACLATYSVVLGLIGGNPINITGAFIVGVLWVPTAISGVSVAFKSMASVLFKSSNVVIDKTPSSISEPVKGMGSGLEHLVSSIFKLTLLPFIKLNAARKTSLGSRILRFSAIGYFGILFTQFVAKELIHDSDYVQCEPFIGGYSKLKEIYDPADYWYDEMYDQQYSLFIRLDIVGESRCAGFDSSRVYPDEKGFTPICYDLKKISDKYRSVCPDHDPWGPSSFSKACIDLATAELPDTTIFRCHSYAKDKYDEEWLKEAERHLKEQNKDT